MLGSDRLGAVRRLGSLAPRALARRFTLALDAERERWVLWLPVAFGTGIATYFALPIEPPLPVALSAPILLLVPMLLLRRSPHGSLLAIGMFATTLGFAAATLRGSWVEAPILAKRFGPASVTALVERQEPMEVGVRLTLFQPTVRGLPAADTPVRVRITTRTGGDRVRPGDWVHLRAVLLPPPAPAAPGAYDFGRAAYFRQLGAVGYAVGPVQRDDARSANLGQGRPVARLRDAIAARIQRALEAPAGAIATALMTGERGAIPEDVTAAMRDSGLAHLLAISGLHVGLVAGIAFFAVRAFLAVFESLALRRPIKKWAAAVALLASFAYLLATGGTIPTQRAFLMITLVLLAVMVDRAPVSFRLVAFAAGVVLLFTPESLLGASFLLSFAAVIALVAAYEALRGRLRLIEHGAGPMRRLGLYFAGVLLTTLVAGLATAPFAAALFGRVVHYSLLANLGAVPIMGFWIMPWALLGYVLMPFGGESLALVPMGWGIDAVLAIAHWTAGLPGAVSLVPAPPAWGISAIALGGLWLSLWRRRWRFWGLPVLLLGAFSPLFAQVPDVLVDNDAKLFAVKGLDGELYFSSRRGSDFIVEIWRRGAGLELDRRPAIEDAPASAARCDVLGCVYQAEQTLVAIVRDPRALSDDCAVADLVISLVPVRRACPGVPAIDRFDIWREGGHAVHLRHGRFRIESVARLRGRRPWGRHPIFAGEPN